jgi:hypothetical protein
MSAQPYHMWSYWRDKKGYEDALRTYYPDDLENDAELRAALTQLTSAEALIDKLMDQRYQAEEDNARSL